MTKLLVALQSRLFDLKDREHGATAVEYGIMVALIAVVIIGAVYVLGGALNDQFVNVNDCLGGGAPCAPPAP